VWVLARPGPPTDARPTDKAALPQATTATELAVTVHGPQTYDVSFYLRKAPPPGGVPIQHATDAFVGEDKLLRAGDTARVTASGLQPGATYEWYAVVRGALLEYSGAEPNTASDEVWTDVRTFSVGGDAASRAAQPAKTQAK